ncbi:hypothetical protein ACFPRL_02395 [Pseudoclavibacter helvolus]
MRCPGVDRRAERLHRVLGRAQCKTPVSEDTRGSTVKEGVKHASNASAPAPPRAQ